MGQVQVKARVGCFIVYVCEKLGTHMINGVKEKWVWVAFAFHCAND